MSRKNNNATIGFWLVLGANKDLPLLVCPALIKDEAIEKIESISIKDAWTVAVQGPTNTHKEAIMLMIPEIINIANLNKEVKKYKSLWEIDAVKAKCEALATKYIEQFKATKT